MVQQEKMLVAKPDNLSSIPRTHEVQEMNQFLASVLHNTQNPHHALNTMISKCGPDMFGWCYTDVCNPCYSRGPFECLKSVL